MKELANAIVKAIKESAESTSTEIRIDGINDPFTPASVTHHSALSDGWVISVTN